MISPNQVSRVAGLFGGMGATPDPAVPADPRQQNAMQAAGVTNPLLQQFGRSVAGLFGKGDQMASPMQQANASLSSLDIEDPDYNLKAARVLMPIDPERASAFLRIHESKVAPESYTYGSSVLYKDKNGKLYQSTQRRAKGSGNLESVITSVDTNKVITDATGLDLQPVSTTTGMTAQQLADLDVSQKRMELQQTAAAKKAEQLYTSISNVREETATLGQLVDSLDEGASVSYFDSFTPTMRAATAKKESIINQLGLQVIQGTTFGALSASELKVAMETAVPPFSSPEDMKKWAESKMAANRKMDQELTLAVNYLETPNEDGSFRTQADLQNWMAQRAKDAAQARGEPPQTPQGGTVPTPSPTVAPQGSVKEGEIKQVGRFTVQSN